jgi:hypothetical protein
MASGERPVGQPQPEEGGLSRSQFLRKMAPGTISILAGSGAFFAENMKRKPSNLNVSNPSVNQW